MHIAHIIFCSEDTFLQITAPPVKVPCPLVVGAGPKPLVAVGASDSVMTVITSRTVVGVT
jgi:hypothetical protein